MPGGDNKPLEINVSGQQWLWRYEYPDGTFSYYELVVPVDTEVVLDIKSTDVLHRWWVPALGPWSTPCRARTTSTWFKADEAGTYEGRSTEFSGPGYAPMRARVTVVDARRVRGVARRAGGGHRRRAGAVQQSGPRRHRPAGYGTE